jgi:hypothetical protein
MVASAMLLECRNGWRLKVTFTNGKAIDGDAYSTREDALLALSDFCRQEAAVRTASVGRAG